MTARMGMDQLYSLYQGPGRKALTLTQQPYSKDKMKTEYNNLYPRFIFYSPLSYGNLCRNRDYGFGAF